MFGWIKHLGRAKPSVFPAAWTEILLKRLPLYERLSEADRRELESNIQWFIDNKHFEGCGGLTMDDEIRVTIAAQACLLLLHRSTDDYDRLKSILVYPSTYFSRTSYQEQEGVVSEQAAARLGESWQHGSVVLAWDSVCGGAANPFDGRNVVFHEFAHQLDQADGRADGAPTLARGEPFRERRAAYTSWARVLTEKYEQLVQKTARGQSTVLDKYGATHPPEFFAVATECFFEKPRQLLKKHPRLYRELKKFYKQDPAGWFDQSSSTGTEPREKSK